jgi:hypothetical protein
MADEIDNFLDAPAPGKADDIDTFLDSKSDPIDAFLSAESGSLDEFEAAAKNDPASVGIMSRFFQSKPVQFLITPIPALDKAKEELKGKIKSTLSEVRRGIPKMGQPKNVVEHAIQAARNSLIPIPTEQMAEGFAEAQIPEAPLDIAGEALFGGLPQLFSKLRLARKVAVVEKASKAMTVGDTVARLENIAAKAKAAPDPLIKVVSVAESRGEILQAMRLAGESPNPIQSEPIKGLIRTGDAVLALDDSIANTLAKGGRLTGDQSKRVFERVADAVEAGEIDSASAAQILGANLDPSELGKTIREVASQQGRALSRWSQIARRLEADFAGNPEALKALNGVQVDPTSWSSFMGLAQRVENIRRAAMVSQLSTSVRNIMTQTGRYSLNALEDAASGTMGAISGKNTAAQAWDMVSADAVSFFRALTPAGRKSVKNVLERFPVDAAKLFNTPIGDVAIDGKVSQFLNTFNTMQEHVFRTAAFDARLRQNLALRGRTIYDVSQIGAKDIDDAVQHALKLTFSASPQGKYGRSLLTVMSHPIMTATTNAFPRFWMGALKFAWEFSPHQLFNPSTYKAMANPDARKAYGAINKAMIGTGFWATGFAADWNNQTGEKWWQLKVGKSENPGEKDRHLDIRPYNPYVAPFFMGRLASRAIKHTLDAMGRQDLMQSTAPDPVAIGDAFRDAASRGELEDAVEKGIDFTLMQHDGEDWLNAWASMRRTDEVGIPFVDVIRGVKGSEKGFKQMRNETTRFLANYLASFSVPLKQVEDFRAGIAAAIPESSELHSREGLRTRTTRLNPIIDATKQNIPFLRESLPVAPQALRGEILDDGSLVPGERRTINPALRQVTGANMSGETPVETEVSRLGIKNIDIYPRTGSPEFDFIIARNMGPLANEILSTMHASDFYRQAGFKTQRAINEKLLSQARSAAKAISSGERPDLALQDMKNQADKLMLSMIEDATVAQEN